MIIEMTEMIVVRNLEVSDEKYWRRFNYDDGLLYCSMLMIDGVDDWRMPDVMSEVRLVARDTGRRELWGYYHNNTKYKDGSRMRWVIPVRYC